MLEACLEYSRAACSAFGRCLGWSASEGDDCAEFITEHTDATFGPSVAITDAVLLSEGHYVVFSNMDLSEAHVFFGWRTADGRSFFFDPQISRLVEASSLGRLDVLKVTYPQ